MTTVPTYALSSQLMNNVLKARNSDGAHSYYSNGWHFKNTTWVTGIVLPCKFLAQSSFMVVFKHSGVVTRNKYQIILGIVNEEDQSRIALQSDKFYTILVTEDRIEQAWKRRDVSAITLKGFHVLEFKASQQGLSAYLDGVSCIAENSVTNRRNEYRIFKPDREYGSPYSIWETHFLVPDIKSNFPRYQFWHKNLKLGFGSYVQFFGDWNGPAAIYIDNDYLGDTGKPGEQIVTLWCYRHKTVITSSAINTKSVTVQHRSGNVPIITGVHCGSGLKAFYSVTVFFGDIER